MQPGLTQADVPVVGARNWAPDVEDARKASDGYLPASRTAAGIQEAADAAQADEATLLLRGEYEIDDTVQIRCDTDGRAARIVSTSTSAIPVVVGGWQDDAGSYTGWVDNIRVTLPRIIQSGRTKGTGTWSGNDIGAAIVKLRRSYVHAPYIDNFTHGLVVAGYGTASSMHWGGTGYNTIVAGLIYDCKIGVDVYAAHPLVGNIHGWANSNRFFVYPRTEDATEGTAVSGARYIRLMRGSTGLYPVTHNVFYSPWIENDFPEYHIELNQAYDNKFDCGRYEPSAGTITVRLANALRNVFEDGFGVDSIAASVAGGTTNTDNMVRSSAGIRYLGSTGSVAVGSGDAFQTGRGATGSRPTASTHGVGAVWFDTTLNKPIWVNAAGTGWVDATGTAV